MTPRPLVLLVANDGKPAARELARAAGGAVEARGGQARLAEGHDAPLDGRHADLVVVFGGDGTVLSALHRLMASCWPETGDPVPLPPVLGVNLGRLGYLTDVAPDAMPSCLPAALEGRLPVSERMLAGIEARRGDRVLWRGWAVNEALVTSSRPGRAIRLEARVDGETVMSYAGDGLLAATPTGSTAYALSAGGPVLSGSARAMALVPVCPHRLSLRTLVTGPGETAAIRGSAGGRPRPRDPEPPCLLSVDGQRPVPLAAEDTVLARIAPGAWRLLRRTGTGYGVLRRKLGWDEGGS